MTPKEKAEELVNKFREYANGDEHGRFSPGIEKQNGKLCALIAVDEISEHCYEVMKPFWQEVKQELMNQMIMEINNLLQISINGK